MLSTSAAFGSGREDERICSSAVCLGTECSGTLCSRTVVGTCWWAKPQVHGSTDVVIKDIVPTWSYAFN